MKPTTRVLLVSALLAVGASALYLPRLGEAPRYLVTDELFSALTAHSVATTGRDPHGVRLPLYFQMDLPKLGRPMWFQPTLVYAIALALKLRPFSEATIRLPMAVAGVANVVLMYLVGRLLFGRELLAVASAVLLALTPAHFMYSRVAMDFQAPLPFILGWLLCLLAYTRNRDARALFAAGLVLGAGMYSYIAAVALMPLYALVTCGVLYVRREPMKRYAVLAFGFLVPLLLSVPAIVRHPTLLFDVAAHYQPDRTAGAATGMLEALRGLVGPGRFREALTFYGGFWNPRLLFVDGPLRSTDATWLVGVFLFPLAGLLVAGILRALHRPIAPMAMVLLVGLVTAPIPASFAGQPEAIRRALELLPFGVLLGVFGLDTFVEGKENAVRFTGFAILWGIVVAVAIGSHDAVPRAQAFVRASTVPLAVAGLSMAFERFRFERIASLPSIAAGSVAIVAAQVAYFLGLSTIVDLAALATLAIAIFLRNDPANGRRSTVVVALLALVASELTFYYVDYTARRLGPIPASAVVMALRASGAAIVLAISSVAAAIARRFADRAGADTLAALTIVAMAYAMVAYFYIDWFTAPVVRFLQLATVFAAAVKAAALARSEARTALRLGLLTAVGVLTLVCLQFAYFYRDYFTNLQARGSVNAVGNVRLALDAALDRADNRVVPALYIARVRNESPGLATVFANFYLTKHGRTDLVDKVVEGDEYMGLEVDRVEALPRGSLVIVSPSSRNDRRIDAMVASGDIEKDALLSTPDGTPMFWILERR